MRGYESVVLRGRFDFNDIEDVCVCVCMCFADMIVRLVGLLFYIFIE